MNLSRKLVNMYKPTFKKTDNFWLKKDIFVKLSYTIMSCATFYTKRTLHSD